MKAIKQCRSCGSADLHQFLDLGTQYLADFREDESKTPQYPLVAVFCRNCTLVQLKHTTPQPEMYHDRYGFKSGVSESIKYDLESVVTHAFQYRNDPRSWLDIASNDGTLLSFVPEDIIRFGVDPVGFLCEEAKDKADFILNDYFTADLFDPSVKFDVVTSVSCFYDMPDPNKFVADVKSVLHPKGVWVIQQNYLLTSIELMAVDNFCHEHIEYYTLSSLEHLLAEHDLEVNEVLLSDVNGGSIRTIVSRVGTYEIDESVARQRQIEADAEVESSKTYDYFADNIMSELTKLRNLLIDAKASGKSIAILAASTRGATIWQSAGIDDKLIDYAVERNPAKVGKWFTSIGVPIISEEEFRKNKPDFAIIGPWFFADEIIEREADYLVDGGKLIVPLPTVRVFE